MYAPPSCPEIRVWNEGVVAKLRGSSNEELLYWSAVICSIVGMHLLVGKWLLVCIAFQVTVELLRNMVHASDSVETAKRETALWFKDDEIFNWKRATEDYVYE